MLCVNPTKCVEEEMGSNNLFTKKIFEGWTTVDFISCKSETYIMG